MTWFFPSGPRQARPLDALFAKDNPEDQKIVLWSAARGSNTDFNNNARNVQGGCGFASDGFASPGTCSTVGATTPANPNLYDHGITQGASDALDAQTLWVQTVRALLRPPPSDAAALGRGQTIFGASCASCHGDRNGPRARSSTATIRPLPKIPPRAASRSTSESPMPGRRSCRSPCQGSRSSISKMWVPSMPLTRSKSGGWRCIWAVGVGWLGL